jgi:hypothetical protein
MSNLYNTLYPYILTSTSLIGAYLAYKHWAKIIRLVIFASVITAFGAFAWTITREPEIIIESKIIEVPPPHKDRRQEFNEALLSIPKQFGIPNIIVETILDKESPDRNLNAYRSEAHNPNQIALAKKFSKNEAQIKMIASSHCPLQIMGYEAEQRGVPWAELYYPKTCVELFGAVWLSKQEICKKNNPSLKHNKVGLLECTAKAWNGSGEKADQYKEEFMAILGNKLFSKFEVAL